MGVLVFGDTETSPTLRHEVPLAIGDPFLYLEAEGRRVVVTNALEDSRIARAAPDLERLLVDAFGRDDLIAEGRSRAEVEREVCVRAIATVGIAEAAVSPEFPLALADRLRAAGVVLVVDEQLFVDRRRRKTATELEGIRRAAQVAIAVVPMPAGRSDPWQCASPCPAAWLLSECSLACSATATPSRSATALSGQPGSLAQDRPASLTAYRDARSTSLDRRTESVACSLVDAAERFVAGGPGCRVLSNEHGRPGIRTARGSGLLMTWRSASLDRVAQWRGVRA